MDGGDFLLFALDHILRRIDNLSSQSFCLRLYLIDNQILRKNL